MTSSLAGLRLLLPALLLAGCGMFAPTVAVEEVGPEEVYEELDAFVLNAGELSAGTRELLYYGGLSALFEDDPRAALRELHAATAREPSRAAAFALAELSFLVGEEEDDAEAYLGSAVYAWGALLGEEHDEPPNPFDRRFRWACDLYNHGLMRALTTENGYVRLVPGRRQLPVGSIELSVDRSGFPGSEEDYPWLLPADRFHIEGLRLRLRDAGLGVALIAVPEPERLQPIALDRHRALAKTPATLFLRVQGSTSGSTHELSGVLELHRTLDARTVEVDGRPVPLEADVSVVLAHSLHRSPLWKSSLRGLLQGEAALRQNRLIFVESPRPGRIPVVFVHGTASNPAYWAEMFNVLLNDPELRARTQCWFFQYTTGNPIIYSAMTLREQLQELVAELDPDGTDPDLRRMVLVGHSQGGLVCKLVLVDGSLAWLERILGRPPAEFGFSASQWVLLTRAFEFDPLPFVERVVYVATPHGGSFEAAGWLSRFVAKLIALPSEVQGTVATMFQDEEKLPRQVRGRIPTSLENMNPGNPLLELLREQALGAGVTAHSIIAIGGADPTDPEELAKADDGVVSYASAHIEPVASERLVPGEHSCQSHPTTISEVRRILRELLAQP